MSERDSPVILGRIAGLFGVRGWIKVFSYTDPREAILDYGDWMLQRDGQWTVTEVVEGQRHGKSVIARLEGVTDRDTAATWIGAEIGVSRAAMPVPEDGRFYWSDLVGLNVVHRDGTDLGRIESMLETGAHDVMVVKSDIERLIPFVMDKVVKDVDLAAGVINVDWEWD